MKKKDLKTGMLIELVNGEIGMVMLDTPRGDLIVGDGNQKRFWCTFDSINDDLFIEKYPTIVKVYDICKSNIKGADFETKNRDVIWNGH